MTKRIYDFSVRSSNYNIVTTVKMEGPKDLREDEFGLLTRKPSY